jgi:hypothetical protein
MPAGGLTLDELLARTGCNARALRMALREETQLGRVLVQDGRFRLRPGALTPDVARALRALTRPDATALARRKVRLSGGPVSPVEASNLRLLPLATGAAARARDLSRLASGSGPGGRAA